MGRAHEADGSDPGFAGRVDTKLAAVESMIEGVEGLLAEHDGVIVGGEHNRNPVWSFLITNLAGLKAKGVTTVYLETLRDDSHQADVDKYLSTGEMSAALGQFTERYDSIRDLNPGLSAFLEAARTRRVRVRGIDGRPARLRGPLQDKHHRRAAAMNTYAEQVVTGDRARQAAAGREPGKYVMELGAAHATAHRSRDGGPVHADDSTLPGLFPGMSELLNVPAVEFAEGGDPPRPALRRIRPTAPPRQRDTGV
ncbi:hypothetical protein OG302_40185 [Streptomyces sp. NBC_01283]|uniref:hypothetical protein n=1 Tax=Streptomyces sp. NBC_01283 TaxID=2903812 RepID=UPI00352D1FFA|nr:hypothetical protein OG302_40185 [Streptomyces sp. NBC_01283]